MNEMEDTETRLDTVNCYRVENRKKLHAIWIKSSKN